MITEKDLEVARQKLQARMDAAVGEISAEDVSGLTEAQTDAAAKAQLSGLDIEEKAIMVFTHVHVKRSYPDIPVDHPLFNVLSAATTHAILIGLQAAATAREKQGASQ